MSGRGKKRSKKAVTATQSVADIVKAAQLAANGEGGSNDTAEDEDDAPDNGMGVVETYSDYWPAKLKIGAKHPDPVVCTASLASVESPDITYELKIPEKVIKKGLLSALQLEAVAYASQAHERFLSDKDGSRAGFLIGDGAGVGKGRTIAGIIYENHLQNRQKSVWISVSNDLKYDAERDFNDIGANIMVHPLNKFHYNNPISSAANGRVTSGVLFSTYASLIAKSTTSGRLDTRLAQIVEWCGEDFDGCIVFDECHKAKNLIPVNSLQPTKTGKAVVDLQSMLPNARVVYSSATGASEPKNMAYMLRLGLWGVGTSFRTFQDFSRTVERRGVGTMEIVAMDMKLRGMYVARQLSFQGVTFKIERVPLCDQFVRMYDESVALWNLALTSFQQAIYLMDAQPNTVRIIWGQFWGAHQRFFKYLAIAAKVDHAVRITQEAVEVGKCVVIGLQSTGEARTLDELEKCDGDLDDFVSTAKAVFQSLVEKQFPALDRSEDESGMETDDQPSSSPNNRKRRERKPVKKYQPPPTSRKRKKVTGKKSQARRNGKRLRIASSSDDDDSMDNLFKRDDSDDDSEDDLVLVEKVQESSSSEDEQLKEDESMESDFDPAAESDVSDDEVSVSSELDTPSESSDSDVELTTKKKSRVKMSKVQEHLQKRHQESNKAKSKNKDGLKSNGLKNVIIESVREMKDELLKQIEELGEQLPKNTLDDLINKLGGSDVVAEMTGRKGRVAGMSDGTVQYESRSEVGVALEMLNMKEKERFMKGEKLIAIISEAASSGISLQSDRRVENKRRRLHITLELPWAADRAIQQFGRTHRSNQVNAPEYLFLISDLAGEQRFVATVARRLESLGALTHGDRRATQTRDLSEFHIDNKFGRKALAITMHAIARLENPMVPPPVDYDGDFFTDVHKALLAVDLNLNAIADEDRKSDNIVRFLNRSLGVPVRLQNHLFKYFSDTLHATILKAKKEKKFDPGLLDIGNPDKIERMSITRFFHRHASGVSPVELHIVRVDRGITWEEALEKSKSLKKAHEGFYIYKDMKANKLKALLAERLSDNDSQPPSVMMFGIYRPNTGYAITSNESLEYIQRTYRKTTAEKAEKPWIYQYDSSVDQCNHAFWSGKCTTSRFTDCDMGKRIMTRAVLSGSVLGVWDKVERQLRGGEDGLGQVIRMQVCRLRSNEGQANTIGILIPPEAISELSDELEVDAVSVEREKLSDVGSDEQKPSKKVLNVKSEKPTHSITIEPKVEPGTEVKSEIKTEVKPSVKIEPKLEPGIEVKVEIKVESKIDTKIESIIEIKSDSESEESDIEFW